jgi:hypothetical protein
VFSSFEKELKQMEVPRAIEDNKSFSRKHTHTHTRTNTKHETCYKHTIYRMHKRQKASKNEIDLYLLFKNNIELILIKISLTSLKNGNEFVSSKLT